MATRKAKDAGGIPSGHFLPVATAPTDKTAAEARISGGATRTDVVQESRQDEDTQRTPQNATYLTHNAEDHNSRVTNFSSTSLPTMSPIVSRKKPVEDVEPVVLDSPFTAIDLTSPTTGVDPSAAGRKSELPMPLTLSSPSRSSSEIESDASEENRGVSNGGLSNDESTPATEESIEEETPEERRRREEEESEALARQLMAEEAMASYEMSTNFLRDNANQYSEEDLAALEVAMAEEDPMANVEEEGEEGEASGELSYDTMLRIGERIGDVKQERWRLIAKDHIQNLPTMKFEPSMAEGKDDNDSAVKCLVCQCPYETEDTLRRLPCGHYFHCDCVDQWLSSKDVCPYCRQSIVQESS